MQMDISTFLSEVEKNRPLSQEERELLRRAYNYAKEAHQGQKRRSGDPYFTHVLAAAVMVARWQLDPTTVVAALLHDVAEDTGRTIADIQKEFGEEVAFLVEGVTKVSRVKYRGNTSQSETLKKMILAISEDIRVVFVKLADRYHNMQTLAYLMPEKQKRIALETTEIYAPLAYRLGLTTVAGDLEDMAFPFLYPAEHRLLKSAMKEHLEKGGHYVAKVKEEVIRALDQQGINYIRVDSRAKRIASLYKKLRRVGMDINNVYDLIALRIIVPTVEDCYAVLGLLHAKWPPLPGMIKDYIALPKPNGYRSLHTTVICAENKPTEFQIRTEEMHRENEYGIAAHWAYNEKKGEKKYLEEDDRGRATFADKRQLSWINQLRSWQEQMVEPDEFIQAIKIDFFKDRIFVITPKGEVIDLAAGSTPVDFAYAIHSEVGDHCSGAKVNGRIVPLDSTLQSGDVVEILTQKNKKPSEAWLSIVRTSRARTRIKSTLRTTGGGLVPLTSKVIIMAEDRIGLLKDIFAVFATNRINIIDVNNPPSKTGQIVIKITVPAEGKDRLDRVILKLQRLKGVRQIQVG
jgi:GTP pyrophosphokinase